MTSSNRVDAMVNHNRPLSLDLRHSSNLGYVRTLTTVEQAKQLQQVAETLGKYSVDVVAEAGSPYVTIGSFDVDTYFESPILVVPEGNVIVDMNNGGTGPQTPGYLSESYEARRARFPADS